MTYTVVYCANKNVFNDRLPVTVLRNLRIPYVLRQRVPDSLIILHSELILFKLSVITSNLFVPSSLRDANTKIRKKGERCSARKHCVNVSMCQCQCRAITPAPLSNVPQNCSKSRLHCADCSAKNSSKSFCSDIFSYKCRCFAT